MFYRLSILSVLIAGISCFSEIDAAGDASRWSSSSVLKEGHWVKIAIPSTGVYKLTYDEIKAMGIEPSRVHLYGYGGGILSENLLDSIPDDLPEVDIFVEKGSDGLFGPGDFLLFYGEGPTRFLHHRSTGNFSRKQNHYSTRGYYFITEREGARCEIGDYDGEPTFDTEVDFFNDYHLHEKELTSIANTGRDLFGESFLYTTEQTLQTAIKNPLREPATLQFRFVAKAPERTALQIEIDNSTKSYFMEPSSPNDSYEKAKSIEGSFEWIPTGADNPSAKVSYAKAGHPNARLDYLMINYKRRLMLDGAFTLFRLSHTDLLDKRIKHTITNCTPTSAVWRLDDRRKPTIVQTNRVGDKVSFVGWNRYRTNRPVEYLVLRTDGLFPKPEVEGRVENQNLHVLSDIDMVIIASDELLAQAQTLADLHRQEDDLSTLVVSPHAIYNEYSSGTPDATAYRRLLKMLFDRAPDQGSRPQYLLLFGDGAMDNRFLCSGWNDTQRKNFLLTYQSENSLCETVSYVSDDYFGFLEDQEQGEFESATLDIGIGRLPITTKEEAIEVVNKIIAYRSNAQRGDWKNQLAFVADDGDGHLHASQADELGSFLMANRKEFVVNKLYLDMYRKETSAFGYRYPDVTKVLLEKLQSGLLMLDYVGHGTTSHWAVEQVLTQDMINALQNKRLPLWVTATCDFSRYDYFTTTAGESALLNPKGGAIALFTTTRVAYSGPNHQLNTRLIQNIFAKRTGGYRLGDVMRETKLALGSDFNKMNFTLLGDPALSLHSPDCKVVIVEVNDLPADDNQEQFKAEQRIKLKAEIRTATGHFADDFNGILSLKVFDCEEEFKTLDNDKSGSPFVYKDRRRVLFSGSSTVVEGIATLTFVVPKEISYSNLQGRIYLYAEEHQVPDSREAQGFYDNFVVGGTDQGGIADTTPPVIHSIYLNDPSFRNADVVNETPMLYIEIADETGINITGSAIGHDIVAILDGSSQTTYTLNSYFTPDSSDFGKGVIAFSLPTLSDGKHTLLFRVWDIAGNSSVETLEFEVQRGASPKLFDLSVDRNPATDFVNFYLQHNRPGVDIEVKMEVYSLAGIPVWSFVERSLSDRFVMAPIHWNLTSSNGQRVPDGIYLYRAVISTSEGGESSKTKKLIINTRY